jgi:ERCC4-type nuclease
MHSQAESLLLRYVLPLLLLMFEAMCGCMGISRQSLNDSLMMLSLVADCISTIQTITPRTTKHLLLKALTVQFQTPRTFAITADLLLLLLTLLFILHMRNYYYIPRTF